MTMQRSTKCAGVIIICLTALGFALPAAAQAVPKAELSVGYQFLRAQQGDEFKESFPAGWYADVVGNVTSMLGIVGEVGGNYKTVTFDRTDVKAKFHNFAGGVRVSGRKNAKAVPFGQVLFGGLRTSFSGGGDSDKDTNKIVQVGGGAKVMQSADASFGVNIGADYIRVFLPDEDQGANVFRFVVGINVPLGMR